MFGVNEFLPNSYITKLLAHYVCGSSWTNPLCGDILFIIAGPDSTQLNNVSSTNKTIIYPLSNFEYI